MTTLAEQAARLVVEHAEVERLELSRHGELLFQLGAGGEPRWAVVTEQGERELDPEQDWELPFSGKLALLRREQEASLLSWRPGRRMVVRLRRDDAPCGVAVVKALRAGRMSRALARQAEGSRVARAAGLGAAEVLAVEPESAAFVLSDLGQGHVPLGVDRAASFARLGAALNRFQRADSCLELELHGVDAELEVLRVLAAKAVRLRGGLPEGWEAALPLVEQALRSAGDGPAVRAHRDLHDGQLLEHEGGLALIDFDLLCLADEALDPGNLLAHLELRALQGLVPTEGARACAAAFRAGYARADEPDLERRIRAWGAAAFLRLALVHHLRPPWAHLGPVLVQRAIERLDELAHERA